MSAPVACPRWRATSRRGTEESASSPRGGGEPTSGGAGRARGASGSGVEKPSRGAGAPATGPSMSANTGDGADAVRQLVGRERARGGHLVARLLVGTRSAGRADRVRDRARERVDREGLLEEVAGAEPAELRGRARRRGRRRRRRRPARGRGRRPERRSLPRRSRSGTSTTAASGEPRASASSAARPVATTCDARAEPPERTADERAEVGVLRDEEQVLSGEGGGHAAPIYHAPGGGGRPPGPLSPRAAGVTLLLVPLGYHHVAIQCADLVALRGLLPRRARARRRPPLAA